MAITPNYSWPLPDDTSLVKDGAEAIRDLGNAIDNTVENLPSGGLVHINTTSFSAVASQSFNDVFSATFDSYKIICLATCSAGANLLFRVRVGGSDLSGANYNRQSFDRSATTSGGSRFQNQTSFQIGAAGSVETSTITEISNSFATKITDIRSGDRFYSNDLAINPAYFVNIGNVNDTTSYTGFTIFPSTGNLTGSVSIYGYAKA